jgi:Protein of unknown function (DUF3261)
MKLRAVLAAALLFTAACRTTRPSGAPVAPLVAVSAEDATQQLAARRAAFAGMKSLMRVRATTGGKTQSFRAQLAVHDLRRMDLIAYTPVGTTALTMNVDGDRVKVKNHVENTQWEGGAHQLPEPFKFLAASYTPNDVALLILGFPLPGVNGEMTAAGVQSVRVGDATFEFATPSFPAKQVVVTRGADRIEIEHLEVVGG